MTDLLNAWMQANLKLSLFTAERLGLLEFETDTANTVTGGSLGAAQVTGTITPAMAQAAMTLTTVVFGGADAIIGFQKNGIEGAVQAFNAITAGVIADLGDTVHLCAPGSAEHEQ